MACALLTSCTPDSVRPANPERDFPTERSLNDQIMTKWDTDDKVPAHISYSDVYTFATGDVVGSSQLVRKPNGISMTLQTSEVTSGDALTVWYVVFNEPGECATTPCGEADIFNPATRTDILYATGHVVGNGNQANFAGSLQSGDNSGSIMGFFNAWLGFNLPSLGLEDPDGAEVHLVLRTHEEALPAFMPDMIQTFNGGCIYPGGVPTDYGAPGPNTCSDIQFAIHLP